MSTFVASLFGISGHSWKAWPPEALLDVLSTRFGMRHLDYWPWNRGELTHERYRELLERYDVDVYVVNVPSALGRLGTPGQTHQAQEALLAAIDEAEILGSRYVQFYPGVPERPEFLTAVKTLVRDLRPILEKTAGRGITLLLENNVDQRMEDVHQLNPSRRPELVLATLEEADSPSLRLTYDPCNFHAAGYEGFPYAYDLLRSYIANVHVKDCAYFSALLHDAAPSHDHLFVDVAGGAYLPVPVGQGTVNWEGIFRRLAADGYDGWLTLEPFSRADYLLEWCTQSMDFLSRHVDLHGSRGCVPRSR
jgi:sugar phosphate isomerase/epimerase